MKTLARILALAVACCSAIPASAAEEFEPGMVSLKLTKVSPRVYYVQGQAGVVSAANEGFNSNAGFVVTDDGVVVFDALGTPALGKALLEQIRKVTRKPVKKIVISHYHADHFYGLQAFTKDKPEVIGDAAVKAYLASAAPAARLEERRSSLAPWVNEHTRIVAPDTYVSSPEMRFSLGGVHFRVIRTGPAHTSEDLLMLVEEEGVLFTGDIVVAGRVPYVVDADVGSWLAAIERLAGYPAKILVTGHGVHSMDASRDVQMTRDYLRFLREAMRKAVRDGVDFEQAYRNTNWAPYDKLPAFQDANRKNAFGAYLAAEQESLGELD